MTMAKRRTVAEMLTAMRGAGWSPKQIQQRTGMSRQAQWSARTGRTPGKKFEAAVREARQKGGGRPPSERRPIAPVSRAIGAGRVMRGPHATSVRATKRTDPRLVREELKRAARQNAPLVISAGGRDVRKYQGELQAAAEFQLFQTGGWDADKFQDRVDNPQPGDDWAPGDYFGAIQGMAAKQGTEVGNADDPQVDFFEFGF